MESISPTLIQDIIESSEEVRRIRAVNGELLAVARSVVYLNDHGGGQTQWILRGLVSDARIAIAKAEASQ